METQYFSFFGEVAIAGHRWQEKLASTISMVEEEIAALMDEIRDYWREVGFPAIVYGAERLGEERPVVLDERDGSTFAKAWLVSPRRAVLLVENGLAGWAQAGVVRWPLQFLGPARIAAADVAPRHGLERS